MNKTITQTRRRHPYQVTYNKRCLKSDCEYPSFFDGQTYFSLCLKHLESEKLGPFFNGRKYDPTEAQKFDWNKNPNTNHNSNNTSKAQPSITNNTNKIETKGTDHEKD